MLRHSPNHGTQRLPNDDDDIELLIIMIFNYPSINCGIYNETLSQENASAMRMNKR